MFIEMPDCSWEEVYKNLGCIRKDNKIFFIARRIVGPVPLCLRGNLYYGNHCYDMTSNRTIMRNILRRYVGIENEDVLTFVWEGFSNSIKHGAILNTKEKPIEPYVAMAFELLKSKVIVTIQDKGMGIENHKKLKDAYQPWYTKLGLEKIYRVAGEHLKLISNDNGTQLQAAFNI